MSPKHLFWIGAKGGLLDQKHLAKMGDAVWLFLYLLLNQTGLNSNGEGIVNYGHPFTFEKISRNTKGWSVRRIRRWATRLRCEGYIRTELHSRKGLKVWVAKGKSKTKKQRIQTECRTKRQGTVTYSRPNTNPIPLSSSPQLPGSRSDSRPDTVANGKPTSEQVLSGSGVMTDYPDPIPKGVISEVLSYYNKDAAAQTAAGVSLIRNLGKEKTTLPRGMSEAEVNKRRQLLSRQSEEVIRKFRGNRNNLDV